MRFDKLLNYIFYIGIIVNNNVGRIEIEIPASGVQLKKLIPIGCKGTILEDISRLMSLSRR